MSQKGRTGVEDALKSDLEMSQPMSVNLGRDAKRNSVILSVYDFARIRWQRTIYQLNTWALITMGGVSLYKTEQRSRDGDGVFLEQDRVETDRHQRHDRTRQIKQVLSFYFHLRNHGVRSSLRAEDRLLLQ